MGRTFAFGVGASLCPFTGLDRIAFCVADARQSSLLLWEMTDLVATFMKSVKKQVNSGFGKPHCCRMCEEDGAGKPPRAAVCSSSLSGCLRFLHLYASMGKNIPNIIPVIEPLLSAGNWGYV